MGLAYSSEENDKYTTMSITNNKNINTNNNMHIDKENVETNKKNTIIVCDKYPHIEDNFTICTNKQNLKLSLNILSNVLKRPSYKNATIIVLDYSGELNGTIKNIHNKVKCVKNFDGLYDYIHYNVVSKIILIINNKMMCISDKYKLKHIYDCKNIYNITILEILDRFNVKNSNKYDFTL